MNQLEKELLHKQLKRAKSYHDNFNNDAMCIEILTNELKNRSDDEIGEIWDYILDNFDDTVISHISNVIKVDDQ